MTLTPSQSYQTSQAKTPPPIGDESTWRRLLNCLYLHEEDELFRWAQRVKATVTDIRDAPAKLQRQTPRPQADLDRRHSMQTEPSTSSDKGRILAYDVREPSVVEQLGAEIVTQRGRGARLYVLNASRYLLVVPADHSLRARR